MLIRSISSYSHLDDEARGARGVERMGQGGFQYRGGLVYPDELYAQLPGLWHQSGGRLLADAYLGNLPQEDVGGVDVNHHVCPREVRIDVVCHLLNHRPMTVTRKDAVHVEVEGGYTTLHGVDAQGIEGGIDIHGTLEFV